jgi:hypothetical protein
MLCGQHLLAFLAPFTAENPHLILIHSLSTMVLGARSSPDGGVNLVPLPGGRIRGGVDGADATVVGFLLCMCFELNVLALAAKWSFQATRPATIASKPPRPNPSLMLIAERSCHNPTLRRV